MKDEEDEEENIKKDESQKDEPDEGMGSLEQEEDVAKNFPGKFRHDIPETVMC